MKLTKRFLTALMAYAVAVTMLCGAASAAAAPVTEETPAQKQAVLELINAARQENGCEPVVETAEADAQADRMAELYSGGSVYYDERWMAVVDTEVDGKVCDGESYSYKLENGSWDITEWNSRSLLPGSTLNLVKSADITKVGISFTADGGVVIMPY